MYVRRIQQYYNSSKVLNCWRLIPETPRWLLAKGRTDEAVKLLRKIAHSNGSVLSDCDVDALNAKV